MKLYSKIQYFFANRDNIKGIFYIILFLIFCFIFLLNITYPLYADDWGYTFKTGSELTEKITSVKDVVESQHNHYFVHGGRVLLHSIGETLLLIGGNSADFINSLAFLLFIVFIYKISNINNRVKPFLLFVITIMVWFSFPAFSHVFLWSIGSAVYLWGGLITVVFLYMYTKAYVKQEKTERPVLKSVLFFFFGIVAGWTTENLGFGLIVILICLILYLKKKESYFEQWMLWGLIGTLIGYVMLVSAPGNYVRYNEVIADQPSDLMFKIRFYGTRMLPVIFDFYKFAFLLTFIYCFTLILYHYFELRKDKKNIVLSFIFFIGAIASDLIMVASPEFPPRAWFPIILFLIISVCIAYSSITINNTLLLNLKILICVFCGISFILSFQKSYKDLYRINKIFKEREQIINQQADKTNFNFVITEKINPQTGFPLIDEIPNDSTHWINLFYVRYHGIKSVSFQDAN